MSARREHGYAAIWLAAVMIFLLGAAALAVDASGFFQQARSQQRAADLACLAGAQELPENAALAMRKAADYVRPNQPGLSAIDPTTPTAGALGAGTAIWQTGDFAVTVETPFGGRATRMRVTISQVEASTFGRAVGTDSATIVEDAVCEVGSALGGAQDMPFGVLGGFTGGIINFGKNQCTLNGQSNDVCSGLKVPRHNDPVGSGAPDLNNPTGLYIANMIAGINWDLDPTVNSVCETAFSTFEPCNRIATVSGDDPSKIYDGLIAGRSSLGFVGDEIGYLERETVTTWSHAGNRYDGHTLGDVADCVGGCPDPWDTVTWEADIAAGNPPDVDPVTLTEIDDCDCPRFARIPVVESFPTADCTVTDPEDPDQVNKCTARVIGFQWVYLMRPYFNGQNPPVGPDAAYNDFNNSGGGQQVRTIAAVAIEFDPDIVVNGRCFSEYRKGLPKAVRLIAG